MHRVYCEQYRGFTDLISFHAQFYAIKHEEERGSVDYKNQIKLCLIEPLWYVFDYNKVLIPIHHCTNHHYTLLMVDNEKKSKF